MSEKIYAWLLRLYPSRFRRAYGDEALQLFRDRSRDEQGLFCRLRLWMDLLCDFALSLPREYFHGEPELVSYPVRLHSEGTPSLVILEDESLAPGALFFGGMTALAAAVTFAVLLHHGVRHVPLSALIRPARGATGQRASSFSPRPSVPASDSRAQGIARTTGQQAEAAEGFSQPEDAAGNPAQNAPREGDSSRPFAQREMPPSSATGTTRGEAKLDEAQRERVIHEAAANLKQHYIDADVAQKVADALVEHEKNGDDKAAADGRAFAKLLTRQMRDTSHDTHLEVLYSEEPVPVSLRALPPEIRVQYRKAMEQENCMFEPVKMLPHNIGYLKLNSFPDPSVCQQTARAAMASLNHADAVIFDLRDTRGGYPDMVMLIAPYLFDHPEYMYNPREDTTLDSWTRSPVPGSRLADKPVYVLTSVRTFSAAEHFSYDLKMLKRATLVGERTAGATDVGTFHRLDDHFGIGIRESRAINPYPEPDWAGIGVEPNVKVNAADALKTAVRLAEKKLERKQAPGEP